MSFQSKTQAIDSDNRKDAGAGQCLPSCRRYECERGASGAASQKAACLCASISAKFDSKEQDASGKAILFAFVCALLILSVFTLSGCSRPINAPRELDDYASNTLFSSFSGRSPRTLDPQESYSSDETIYVYGVYEMLYGYHYLKRPYELVPRAAEKVAAPIYYDKDGNEIESDGPSNSTYIWNNGNLSEMRDNETNLAWMKMEYGNELNDGFFDINQLMCDGYYPQPDYTSIILNMGKTSKNLQTKYYTYYQGETSGTENASRATEASYEAIEISYHRDEKGRIYIINYKHPNGISTPNYSETTLILTYPD